MLYHKLLLLLYVSMGTWVGLELQERERGVMRGTGGP